MRAVRYWMSSIILASASVAVVPQAMAQQEGTTPDSVPQSLQAKVDELDQQVRILQRLRELAADSAAAAAKDKISATASSKDGFSIKSADGKYAVRLKGLVQTDGRFFLSDSAFPLTNTFFLRRARPILEATVGKYLEFRLQPDFGQGQTVLFDAYSRREGLARVRRSRRQVQAAGGPRAAPVGERHRVRRAGAGHQPRAEPGRRPPGLGRHLDRHLHLRGRRLQRRPRPGQRRRRRRPTRRTSPARIFLQPFKTRLARRPRLRRRGQHRHRARHDRRAGARELPHRRPADLVPLPQQHHHPGQQRLRRRHPPAARAAGLLVQRPARPPRRVHRLVAGGEAG